MKLKTNDIIIGERQRLDIGDLSDLDSMSDKDVGQILPIIVHKTLQGWELVDGRRRLAKAVKLGWPEVRCEERDQLTVVQKNKMELFADIGRLDRSWQDICLSINKINNMMVAEKRGEGIAWTCRAMATFTGYSKSTINYFLRVAEALELKPRDEQIWSAGSYIEAFKILIQRQHDEARSEMERRRQIVNADQFKLPMIEELGIKDETIEVGSESLVQQSDSTQGEDRQVEVLIHGFNMAFEDAVPDEHFMTERAYLVLVPMKAPTNKKFWTNIKGALRNEGFAVSWNNISFDSELVTMPSILLWNKVATLQETTWPYVLNYAFGYVYAKQLPTGTNQNPSSATISCHSTEPDEFPPAVVEFSLVPCPPGVAVLCPWRAPVVAVAESGRIPIFFEADKVRFEQKCTELKDYYESIIPGVTVKLRGT